jgi:O-antigen/teichoic acid export membrane protein
MNASMTSATQRYISIAMGEGDYPKINKIFNMSILLHLRVVILIFVVLEIVGLFIFDGVLNIEPHRLDTAKLIYQFMIISTLLTVITVPYDALLNARENMLFYAIVGIIESLLKLAIAFYITFIDGDKLIYYGALMALLSISILMITRLYCNRKYPESKLNIKANYDKKLLKDMTGFAGWSFLGFSSSMISSYGQGIVLNVFFGTIVNAAQGIANQVSGQLGALATTMMKALMPVIAKSEGAGNRDLMIKASMMGSKASFFLLMILYVPVMIEMPYIFKIWLKDVPGYAVVFCELLLIRNLIEQIFLTLYVSISAVGNIKYYQIFYSISWSLPIVLSVVLFKMGFEPYYMYISFFLYTGLYAILNLYFSHRNFKLGTSVFLNNVVVRCFTAFGITFIISYLPVLFMEPGLIRIITVGLTSVLLFASTVWLIGFTLEERTQIKQIIVPWIHKFPIINKLKF